MRKIGVCHLCAIGTVICLLITLIWLFSPKPVALLNDLPDIYSEIIGSLLGTISAFSVSIGVLYLNKCQRRKRYALGISSALHLIHEEFSEKLDLALYLSFGTSTSKPALRNLEQIYERLKNADSDRRKILVRAMNQSFTESSKGSRLDEYLRDIEEFSPDIHSEIISVRQKCHYMDRKILTYDPNFGALNDIFFDEEYSSHVRTSIEIIQKCRSVIEKLKNNYNKTIITEFKNQTFKNP